MTRIPAIIVSLVLAGFFCAFIGLGIDHPSGVGIWYVVLYFFSSAIVCWLVLSIAAAITWKAEAREAMRQYFDDDQ